NSLYDVMAASSIANRFTLIEHHRSADAIINFSNRQFYGGDLVIATRQRNLKRRTDTPTIDWVDVAGQVTSPGGSGALNQAEVEAVVTYLKDLLVERAYDGTVGVVTPFRKHANRIRDAVERDSDLRNVMSRSNLLVDTVHRFQGDERDIIIFSPVISLNISLSGLNFLKSQGNLFNVAITRARAHLVVIGDIDFCRKSGVKYLSSFVSYYEELERARPLALLDPATLTDAHPFATDPRVSHWEVVFYKALREAGLQPIPQYGVDKYALDFAVFRKDGAKLDIEVDGELYHKTWTGQTVRADTIRNQSLIELGWQVKRFWVYRLNEDLSSCVREIVKWASAGK
ncbi:MAG: DUF559 domain-containing protein, partial [Bdellovibrionales bacterium]|nr:DUF559 domain-containing protein [Bdellovibrionales bacterium]